MSIQWPRTYARRDSAAHNLEKNSTAKIPVMTHSRTKMVLCNCEPGSSGTNASATKNTANAAKNSSHAISWRATKSR